MRKIGVTGGIGSGKSLVCRLFNLLGIPSYDSDARAKWLMAHHPGLKAELVAAFGPETFSATGELDRGYLARLVFKQPALLTQLNGLVHPRVGEDFAAWVARQQAPVVIKEAALLFEAGSYRSLNQIVTVAAPLAVRIQRVLARDPHRTQADVEAIIAKQLPEAERLSRADHILYNDEQQPLIPQVLRLTDEWMRG